MTSTGGRSDGYTLIEVLVAFAILSVGLVTLLSIFSTGLHRDDEIRLKQEASALSKSVLAEVGTDIPLVDGVYQAKVGGGLTWKVSIRSFAHPDAGRESPVSIREVVVVVGWGSREGQSVMLKTLRLANQN